MTARLTTRRLTTRRLTTRRLTSVTRRAALAGIAAVLLGAHVGSPNVFWVGRAGPWGVSVVVRPPQVIPGMAEVTVRLPDAAEREVRSVTVRPVFWQTGSRGSPQSDTAVRVAAPGLTYAGKLWFMRAGAYAVAVTVSGARGTATASVPVGAVATGWLPLPPILQALLVVLGFVLFFGMLTIVHAAAGESLVAPDEPAGARRRGARLAAAIALPVLVLLVFGGWRWWSAEASAYERRLYRPLDVRASVERGTLSLSVVDSAWTQHQLTAIIPDHGRIMHMFLVREPASDVFAHVHPAMVDSATFRVALPALPAGRYRVYGDVVHESGFERTLVAGVTIADSLAGGDVDPDDAWTSAPAPTRLASGDAAPLGDGLAMRWAGNAAPFVAGRDGELRFAVRDAAGAPAAIEPYLGMAAHAVVARDDGAVFAHLHPMGTATTVAQQALLLRDRGDTTANGRLRLADTASLPHAMSIPAGTVAFPYAFPSPGRYHLWVQLRSAGRVRTGTFTIEVAPAADAR